MSAPATPGGDAQGASLPRPPRGIPGSLCPACVHVKVVSSEKGSTFFLCQRARTDPRFAKYPPQPVVVCSGYER